MSEVLHKSPHASHLTDNTSTRRSQSSSSITPTQRTVNEYNSLRPQNSSSAVQFAPSSGFQRSQGSPHVQFPSASVDQTTSNQQQHPADQQRHSSHDAPPSPVLQPKQGSMLSLNGSAADSPGKIKVKNLSHIQSFASEEFLSRSRQLSRHSLKGKYIGGQQYEISQMPVQDIIEMVAGLLTKITTTNDHQHEHLHRHIPPPEGSSKLTQQATSVLAFHGKNVPSITIASYLNRIHKYCPTTYEVFLSLLVYFDRMTEMVNKLATVAGNGEQEAGLPPSTSSSNRLGQSNSHASPDLKPRRNPLPGMQDTGINTAAQTLSPEHAHEISHFFILDSYNIHRLVMAGVTCASKFFSDVFYTNSRYAKVDPSVLLLLLQLNVNR